MKEVTLSTLDAKSLPVNLRRLATILPEATWNGYNVWVKSSDKTRMKSLGFHYSKAGKHARMWFTNERAQESFKAKSVHDKSQEPAPEKSDKSKARKKSSKAQEESYAPREICAVVEIDMHYNNSTVRRILAIRAQNCTDDGQIISWLKSEAPTKCLACKSVSIISSRQAKIYKSDRTFLNAVKRESAHPEDVREKVINLNFAPKKSIVEKPTGKELCAIVEWDMPKTKAHMINLFRIKNGTIDEFTRYAKSHFIKGVNNLAVTLMRHYAKDGDFIRAFTHKKDYIGKEFLHAVQSIDLAKVRTNAA